ncbi:MAG: UDP-N-acetylmuramoyl-tripeptide--D-alanyl-D-alanine ligase [Bacteroidales bacterium]|nr:UDP-N-acetylmuramoyl-tripeptide--D-alanyl-D-alanine ligase [Bacteroidales bacterium]
MSIEELYGLWKASKGVNTDSRTIEPGQIFVALKGENFDGNAYALKALEAGASYAIVSSQCGVSVFAAEKCDKNTSPTLAERLIPVEDTLQTLKELAAYHRQQLQIPVIGLTGTNGKTTTKELIREVLGVNFRVAATKGNLNNDIGVPLTVLSIGEDADIAVVEMGANHPEDITSLTWVSQPSYGLITNVGKAHLEGFGSFEGVKHAKGRLYDWLSEHDGTAFVNTCSEDLVGMASARHLSIVPYGVDGVTVRVLPASAEEPYLRMVVDGRLLETHLVGAYNATNVMAALTVGQYFGVSLADALAAVAAYEPSMNRSQLVRSGSNTIIEDAYNANPSSMAVALDNLAAMSGPRAALLGEMRELGADSVAEHAAVVRRLMGMGLERVCLVGPEFQKALSVISSEAETRACERWPQPKSHDTLLIFDSSDALAAWLAQHPLTGCTVLVKGSRGTRMEKVLPAL